MKDLREKTIRAGFANFSARIVITLIRILSIVVLARLLTPADYGLVGMVTTFTDIFYMICGFGLLQAAVQRETVTEEQASTLFWLNVMLGGITFLITVALGPALNSFFGENRLFLISAFVALGFLFYGAGVQHCAVLQRQMRFGAFAWINVSAMLVAVFVAIGMALCDYGYWSLVSMSVSVPLVTTLGAWVATGWVPGRPRRVAEIWSMMHFGGGIILSALIVYVSNNIGKLLLGRSWGAEAIGIYGRASTLVMLPTDTLINSTIGEVAFASLSRAKEEPDRLGRYFIKGFSLVQAITIPIAAIFILFTDELV